MIVQQDPQVDVSKTTFAPVTSRSAENTGSSDQPPAYHSSMAFGGYQPIYPSRTAGERAKPRFWRAFTIGVLIVVLIHFLMRTIIELGDVNRGRGGWGPGGMARDWPEFSTGEVQKCVDRPDWPYNKPSQSVMGNDIDVPLPGMDLIPPYSSSVSFALPANTDLLYFLSRGSLAYGSVHIEAVPGSGDDVNVDVEVGYWSEAALERASVCKLEKEDGTAHGVGIFTPRNWHTRGHFDSLRFIVRVQIPVSSNNTPRVIKALETDYSNFRHEIGDTLNLLKFDSLSLSTSNSVIASGSVFAKTGVVKSSNGAIEGTYNTSTSLRLQTTNAHINALINLSSESNSVPTDLILKTSNGFIDGAVNLVAPGASDGTNSAFTVQSTTSNARLNLVFPSQPLNSFLSLDAKSSNARAEVGLHPAFEGSFQLRTSNAGPALKDENPRDPSGQGRRRRTNYQTLKGGYLNGNVQWDDEGGKKSWAHVASSNAPVILTLKDI